MESRTPHLAIERCFGSLPLGLRKELVSAFNELIDHYSAGRWGPAEMNGGKLCEVVYTILVGYLGDEPYAHRAQKPSNMLRACQALEQYPKDGAPHSFRVLIPRMLTVLYDVRNNRSVGHVGGDVDPNHMDAGVVAAMAKWIVAEIVRVLHDLSVVEATDIVEALVERQLPIVWLVDGNRRVLDTSASTRDQILILLYSHAGYVQVDELIAWTEYGNISRFRSGILTKLHRERLVELQTTRDIVYLSPLGVADVEHRFAARFSN